MPRSRQTTDETPQRSESEFHKIFARSLPSAQPAAPSFCSHGQLPDSLVEPRVVVGDRDVGFPLTESGYKHIADAATVSPCGVGVDKTVVDLSIRSSLELQPMQFTIRSKSWEPRLTDFVRKTIAPQLHIEPLDAQFIQLHLYKLLIYPTSTFFKAHRDTEKIDGHFATLVVQLPSVYTGGQLTFAHNEELVTADLSGPQAEDACWYSAHYTDVTHQVAAITSGTRVALIYNLEWKGKPERAPSVNVKPALEQVMNYLRTHSGAGFPPELRFALKHCYTPAALKSQGIRCLKGLDAKVYSLLKSAATQLERLDRAAFAFFILERQLNRVDVEDEDEEGDSHDSGSITNDDPNSVFSGGCDREPTWNIFDEQGKDIKDSIHPTDLFGHSSVTRTMSYTAPVYPRVSTVYHAGYGNEGPSIERTYRGYVLLAVPASYLPTMLPQSLSALARAIPKLTSNPNTAVAATSSIDRMLMQIKEPDASSATLINSLGAAIASTCVLSDPADFSTFLSRVQVFTKGICQAIEARGGADAHKAETLRLVQKLPAARRAEVLGIVRDPGLNMEIYMDIVMKLGPITFAELAEAVVKLSSKLQGTDHPQSTQELWGLVETHHTLRQLSDVEKLTEDTVKVLKSEQSPQGIPVSVFREVLNKILSRTSGPLPSKDLLTSVFLILHRCGYPELCADDEILQKYLRLWRTRCGNAACDNLLIEAFHIIRIETNKAMKPGVEPESCTGRMNSFARGPLTALLLEECHRELAPGPPVQTWAIPAPYCGTALPQGFEAFCASSEVSFTTPTRSFSGIADARSWCGKVGNYFECRPSGAGSNAVVAVKKKSAYHEERKTRYREILSLQSQLTSWAMPVAVQAPLANAQVPVSAPRRDAKRPREAEEIVITDDEN